ncbi:ORF48 [callitrichine gammaherpesvirus 3]|uniref:ORF48 n=1 Tax=callitrichine gammaherpesvirus 3 TaxID=106331 RepID=Q993G1_9GAMA|nr:ORF48 [callitrichine gammaherpesvirus 3]AAK38257.1 ORF48 [callitrichine gammaherpesvirus 3]
MRPGPSNICHLVSATDRVLDVIMSAQPCVNYAFSSDKFLILPATTRLTLVNKTAILVRPFKTCILDLGLYAKPPENHGLVLWGVTTRPVTPHTGIIDPGYTGMLKLILHNKRSVNSTLRPGELTVHLAAFKYHTPTDVPKGSIINQPQYEKDVGLDVSCPSFVGIFPQQTITIRLSGSPPKIPHFRSMIFGRSGLACKGLIVRVTKWRRDGADVCITNYSAETVFLNEGDRCCQLVYLHKEHLTSFFNPLCDTRCLGSQFLFTWAKCIFREEADLLQKSAPRTGRDRSNKGFGSSGE